MIMRPIWPSRRIGISLRPMPTSRAIINWLNSMHETPSYPIYPASGVQLTKEDYDWPDFAERAIEAAKNVSLGRGFHLVRRVTTPPLATAHPLPRGQAEALKTDASLFPIAAELRRFSSVY